VHFLQRPAVRPHRRHVYNQYVVRVGQGQRDALLRILGGAAEVRRRDDLRMAVQRRRAAVRRSSGNLPCIRAAHEG